MVTPSCPVVVTMVNIIQSSGNIVIYANPANMTRTKFIYHVDLDTVWIENGSPGISKVSVFIKKIR